MDDYSEMHKLQFDKEFPLDWIVRNSTDFQNELLHEFMNASLLPNYSLYLYDFLGITGVEWLKLYEADKREESKITDHTGYKECMAPMVPISDFAKRNSQARSAYDSEIVNNTLDKKYFVPDLLNTNIVKVFTKLQIELERFRKALFLVNRSNEVTETAKNIHLIIEQLQPQFVCYTLNCLIDYISEMRIFPNGSSESIIFDTANKSLISELKAKLLSIDSNANQRENKIISFSDLLVNCNKEAMMLKLHELLDGNSGSKVAKILEALKHSKVLIIDNEAELIRLCRSEFSLTGTDRAITKWKDDKKQEKVYNAIQPYISIIQE